MGIINEPNLHDKKARLIRRQGLRVREHSGHPVFAGVLEDKDMRTVLIDEIFPDSIQAHRKAQLSHPILSCCIIRTFEIALLCHGSAQGLDSQVPDFLGLAPGSYS